MERRQDRGHGKPEWMFKLHSCRFQDGLLQISCTNEQNFRKAIPLSFSCVNLQHLDIIDNILRPPGHRFGLSVLPRTPAGKMIPQAGKMKTSQVNVRARQFVADVRARMSDETLQRNMTFPARSFTCIRPLHWTLLQRRMQRIPKPGSE